MTFLKVSIDLSSNKIFGEKQNKTLQNLGLNLAQIANFPQKGIFC